MQAKPWIKIWFIISSLVFFVGIFNFIVDSNGMNRYIEITRFNKIKSNKSDTTPIRYKMPRLRSGDWDNLMMGTSSIGVMNNAVVSEYLGGKTFNLSQPASAMSIQLDVFKYAVHFNKIKNVVYAVDFISFNKHRRLNADYIQEREKLKSFDYFYSYKSYFNLMLMKDSLSLIWKNYHQKIKPSPRYMEDGRRVYQNYIYAQNNNTFDLKDNMDRVSQFLLSDHGYYEHYEFSDEYMSQFKSIVSYCKKHNIELYVYISPLYKDFISKLYIHDLGSKFESFKIKLAEITPYKDFTRVSSMTMTMNNFWDPLHLKVEKTPFIMRDLFKKDDELNISVYMDETNIQSNLVKQKKDYKDFGVLK